MSEQTLIFDSKMNEESNKKTAKKRIRRPTLHKFFLNKQKVQKGQEHFSPTGNLIKAKTFKVVVSIVSIEWTAC